MQDDLEQQVHTLNVVTASLLEESRQQRQKLTIARKIYRRLAKAFLRRQQTRLNNIDSMMSSFEADQKRVFYYAANGTDIYASNSPYTYASQTHHSVTDLLNMGYREISLRTASDLGWPT